MEMHLFHWSKIGDRLALLIYARSESEAISYLQTIPLWWNQRFEPAQFKKVVPPKGPSPSILMYDIGNTISAD